MITSVMDVLNPLNESRKKEPLFHTEHFVDEDRYYYSIYFHLVFMLTIAIIQVIVADCFLANFIQHVIGLFDILE